MSVHFYGQYLYNMSGNKYSRISIVPPMLCSGDNNTSQSYALVEPTVRMVFFKVTLAADSLLSLYKSDIFFVNFIATDAITMTYKIPYCKRIYNTIVLACNLYPTLQN